MSSQQQNFSETSEALEILAQTIYGEARGEAKALEGGLAALMAVANVVMNRVKEGGWFGRSVKEVCLKPRQFSCWEDGNVEAMQKARAEPDAVYRLCQRVAQGVAQDGWPDLTNGANHYYSDRLPVPPVWVQGRRPEVKIGHHLFFKI